MIDIIKFIEKYVAENGLCPISPYKGTAADLIEKLHRVMDVVYVEPLFRTDFSVTGSGQFPVDMLRYTCSWPATEADARAIEESHEHHDMTDTFTIRLSKYHRDKDAALSEDRWRSKFKCQIVGTVETVEL